MAPLSHAGHFTFAKAMLSLLLAAFIPFAYAQNASEINDIPSCALSCFASAIQNTTCGLTDFYCQCTTGREAITNQVLNCLCGSTCNSDSLFKIEQGTLKICREALSSSSQTYIAPTITSIPCQGLSLTPTATATDLSGNAEKPGSTGNSAPFPTPAPLLAGVCFGMAGLAACML